MIMSQAYSDPSRAADPHALPDIEVFYHLHDTAVHPAEPTDDDCGEHDLPTGWYWWSCSPGCLPDGDPNGPFASEAEALADAQSGMED
jgi:hypothetical protein